MIFVLSIGWRLQIWMSGTIFARSSPTSGLLYLLLIFSSLPRSPAPHLETRSTSCGNVATPGESWQHSGGALGLANPTTASRRHAAAQNASFLYLTRDPAPMCSRLWFWVTEWISCVRKRSEKEGSMVFGSGNKFRIRRYLLHWHFRALKSPTLIMVFSLIRHLTYTPKQHYLHSILTNSSLINRIEILSSFTDWFTSYLFFFIIFL